MKRGAFAWFGLLSLLLAAPVAAQPRPVVATTLTTTDTSADSLHVGCAVGASSCTGGIKAGPVDVSSIVLGAGGISIASGTPAVTTNKLYQSASTLFWNGVALATGSSLSGTLNKIPVFTASNAVGDSIMSQSGTTITVASTLNATTLGGTLSTASQPNVTTMAGLTSAAALATVGTIGSGTWQGTVVGLTYGGTGSNLSATGGTSQFLRQNGVGSAITVIRPAVADLSDASNVALLNATGTVNFSTAQLQWNGGVAIASSSNVALLNAANAFTNTGLNTFAGGIKVTGGAGTGGGTIRLSGGTILDIDIGSSGMRWFDSADSNQILNLTSTAWSFYTNNTIRWGINSAGDRTFGPSSHIADSNGTPTVASGCGGSTTLTGTDYAFAVSKSSGTDTTCTVNFGHTFSSTPVCVAINGGTGALIPIGVSTSTTQATISYASSAAVTGFNVLCRGF